MQLLPTHLEEQRALPCGADSIAQSGSPRFCGCQATGVSASRKVLEERAKGAETMLVWKRFPMAMLAPNQAGFVTWRTAGCADSLEVAVNGQTRTRCSPTPQTQTEFSGLIASRSSSKRDTANNYVCRNLCAYSPRNTKLSSIFGDPQTITNVSRLACSMRLETSKRPGSRCREALKGDAS